MRSSFYAAASLLAIAAVPCQAQESTTAPTSADGSATSSSTDTADSSVGEIVVTARLRSETLQSTPMSVGVATAQALENAHVTTGLDLASVVPGLVLQRAPASLNTAVTVRGLGSTAGAATTESSIAFFINGVYLPRSRDFSNALFDADHIEVVRGTQGSLLGKNTSLGAVNLITRAPGDKLEANVSASHEFNFDSWTVTGGVSFPISDTLSVRLAGIYDQQGGWVRNVVTGGKGGASSRVAGRATVKWTPSVEFDATLLYEHQDVKLTGLTAGIAQTNAQVITLSTLAGFPNITGTALDRITYDADSRIPDGYVEKANVDRVSLTAHWNLGDSTIMSQTAWSDSKGSSDLGADYVPGDYFRYLIPLSDGSSFSQELRFTSPAEESLRYVIGGWYGRNTVRQVNEWNADYPAPPVSIGATDFINRVHQTTDSWSAFGQLDFDIVERLTLSGGLRYTNEKKAVDFARDIVTPGLLAFAFPAYAPFTFHRKESVLDGLVNVSFKASDNLMVYAAWAQGTKSGGFADSVGLLDQSEFRPERARTAEFGVRFQTSDRSLTANATIFSTHVKDYQLVLFNGITFAVSNTQLESQGVESQIIYRPAFLPGFKIDWSNTYAHAKDKVTGGLIPNAPRWSGGVSFAYEHPITDGFNLNLTGGVNYESSQARGDNSAVPIAAAIAKYDASIGIEADAGYAVRLFARNLTNANRAVFTFPTAFVGPGSYVSSPEQPRTIMLEVSYKF